MWGKYLPFATQKNIVYVNFPPATGGLLRLQKGGELEETPQPVRPARVPQDEHLI